MYDPLNQGYSIQDFQEFLESNNVAALASISPDWGVQVTSVFYAVESKLTILIKSHVASDHIKSILINPKISVAIHKSDSSYKVKSGMQLRGICSRIRNREEMEKAVAIYSETYQGAADRFASIDELISDGAKSTMFRITFVSGKMLTPEGYSPSFQSFG